MKPSVALPGGGKFTINAKRITVMATLFDAFQMVKTIRPILGPQRSKVEVAGEPSRLPQIDVELAGISARGEDLAE